MNDYLSVSGKNCLWLHNNTELHVVRYRLRSFVCIWVTVKEYLPVSIFKMILQLEHSVFIPNLQRFYDRLLLLEFSLRFCMIFWADVPSDVWQNTLFASGTFIKHWSRLRDQWVGQSLNCCSVERWLESLQALKSPIMNTGWWRRQA